jgi:tetratricopeptide (TPR) repeat protein
VTPPDDANSLSSEDDPESVVSACLAELARNAPADAVLARLRTVESSAQTPPLRARFLRARAIATNRLGFAPEALADLLEARRIVQTLGQPHELVEVTRMIALVHAWRGEGREAALALLQAVAAAGADTTDLALVLAEAGRLEMEIGRPQDAVSLLARALDLSGAALPPSERERALVNIVQALVTAGRIDEAQARLDSLVPLISEGSRRAQLLVCIESMRIALARSNLAAARNALCRAAKFVSPDPNAFSRVELAHAEAEVTIAEGDAAKADRLLREVIARYADSADDLAGREISARLLHAQALDALQRPDEVDRTLAAALRRAQARGLLGYADTVRGRIAARGGAPGAWFPNVGLLVPGSGQEKRFVRRRPIGSGGFGSVERAYDLELGLEVALKRISLAGLYDDRARSRLIDSAQREIAATSRIEHPGVVRIYGMLSSASGDLLVVEELVEGPNLRKLVGAPMRPALACELLARIAFALAAVHAAGVVHRDLKPENVILRGQGSPVLVDFGIAMIRDRLDKAPRSGTRDYMAPEQTRGRSADQRADIYALGVIAHEVLLGRLPDRPKNGLDWLWRGSGRRIYRDLNQAGVERDTAELIAQLLTPLAWQRPRSASLIGTRLLQSGVRVASGY